jgi:hypothetical protein
MKRFLILAGVLLTGLLPFPAAAVNWTNVERVEQRIEQLGARVLWMRINTNICAQRGLLGLYSLNDRTVYMCQQSIREVDDNRILATLQHEGWHAVQHLCNGNRAVLSDDKIRKLISESDKRNLRNNYDASQHRMEAEARALENLPTHAFLNGVNHYCS